MNNKTRLDGPDHVTISKSYPNRTTGQLTHWTRCCTVCLCGFSAASVILQFNLYHFYLQRSTESIWWGR